MDTDPLFVDQLVFSNVPLLDIDEDSCVLFGHDPGLDEIIWTGELPTLSERGAEANLRSF